MISKHRIAKSVELEGAEDCNEDDKREPFTNMIELMHSAGMKEEDILSEVKTMITAVSILLYLQININYL